MSETRARARKWRRRGAYCITFGVLLEVLAGADVAWAALAGHVTWWLLPNLVTAGAGVFCINRGLTVRHMWLWALG